MAYLAAVLFIMSTSGFCMTYFVKIVVPMRRPLLYALLSVGCMDFLWAVNYYFYDGQQIVITMFMYLTAFVLLLLFAHPGCRFRAVLVQMFLILLPLILSFAVGSLLMPAADAKGIPMEEFVKVGGEYYLTLTLLLNILTCILEYGTARLLKMILGPGVEKNLLWFLTIPVTQVILMIFFVNLALNPSGFRGGTVCVVLGVLLNICSDSVCVWGYRKYQGMQRTNQMLRDTEHQLELQAEHYRNLQEDIVSVNEIRHDLKNQLQAAYYLLEQGNSQEVRQQLDFLDRELSQKVGSRYCENLMVDAVLAEKDRLCQDKHITLKVSALVPQKTSVENAYLCSAFSNLLDNSIRAVSKLPDSAGPIELRSDLQGDYLVIHCSNPSDLPKTHREQTLMREHGLGLQILEQIAKMGGGNFETKYENGIFTAVLVIKR